MQKTSDLRKTKNQRLKNFYAANDINDQEDSSAHNNTNKHSNQIGDPEDPLNIDAAKFNAREYMGKMLFEKDLSDLLAKETEIYEQIRSLDSEMQTLVYDNYNRFIYATDTIKMMKTDFHFVENEMQSLASKMSDIKVTAFELKSTLNEHRDEMKSLTSKQESLKRLNYLFNLPRTLKECMSQGNWLKAIRHHRRASTILTAYCDVPGLLGIRKECEEIMSELVRKTRDAFATAGTAEESLKLMSSLKQMKIPLSTLIPLYLENMCKHIDDLFHSHTNFEFEELKEVFHLLEKHSANYFQLFLLNEADDEANFSTSESMQLIIETMVKYTNQLYRLVSDYVEMQPLTADLTKVIKDVIHFYDCIDRFFNSLFEMIPEELFETRRLYKDYVYNYENEDQCLHGSLLALIVKLSDFCAMLALRLLEIDTTDKLDSTMRQINQVLMLQNQKLQARQGQLNSGQEAGVPSVTVEMYQDLSRALASSMRDTLTKMKMFFDPTKTFTVNLDFHLRFCVESCREYLIVSYLEHLLELSKEMAKVSQGSIPVELMVIFAKLLYDWAETGTIGLFLNMIDEILLPKPGTPGVNPIISMPSCRKLINAALAQRTKPISNSGPLSEKFRQSACILLGSAARIKGAQMGSLLQKSVETRDWLRIAEPRSVRSVVKRVVEVDLTGFCLNVAQTLPSLSSGDGAEHSLSGSSLVLPGSHLSQYRHLFSGCNKSEFVETVKPYRDSIVCAAIQTALKTLIESIRLKTFSKLGVQQMQIDCHSLRMHFQNLVSDPQILFTLVEEAMISTQQRCIETVELRDEKFLNTICLRQ